MLHTHTRRYPLPSHTPLPPPLTHAATLPHTRCYPPPHTRCYPPTPHPTHTHSQCPNRWIVGHGMDTAQIYRSLPYIGVLSAEAQARFLSGIKK